MKKFIEWMHGKGRNIVMLVMMFIALGIVLHYFVVEREGYIGSGKPNVTTAPEERHDSNFGGDSIGPAPTATVRPAVSAAPRKSKKKAAKKAAAQNQSTQKAAQEAEEEHSDQTITLGFAGDICLDGTSSVMRHLKQKGGLSQVISPSLIQKMKSYDHMILNNEFSISKKGKPMAGKAYTFRSHPNNVKYLKALGVDVAGLANNHVFDYGRGAFLDTLYYLKKAGIQTVGAGKNSREARKPAYFKVKGKIFAIVAATRAEKYVLTPEAKKHTPGVFRTYDDSACVKVIRQAKKKADYVIAYVHWGTEYSTDLEQAQLTQAKDYINAGADAVIGAHTHCLQGVGYYKGAPIFYSLGNFWFNEKTLYTTVVEMKITGDGTLKSRMLPCIQRNKETKLLTQPSKKKKFVHYVNAISTNAKLTKNGWLKKK